MLLLWNFIIITTITTIIGLEHHHWSITIETSPFKHHHWHPLGLQGPLTQELRTRELGPGRCLLGLLPWPLEAVRWAVVPEHVDRRCYGGHQQHRRPESTACASNCKRKEWRLPSLLQEVILQLVILTCASGGALPLRQPRTNISCPEAGALPLATGCQRIALGQTPELSRLGKTGLCVFCFQWFFAFEEEFG